MRSTVSPSPRTSRRREDDPGPYDAAVAAFIALEVLLVPGTASPDDPALADYWARRRTRQAPLDGLSLRLLQAQHGRCRACGDLLLLADREPQTLPEWEQWLAVTRKAVRKQAVAAEQEPGSPDDPVTFRLVHAHCQQRPDAAADTKPSRASPASTPSGAA